MNDLSLLSSANFFRYTARFSLLIIGLLVFVFALFSGAENSDGLTTFTGIIKNSPNALPWLVILLLVGIAWKYEMIGGTLIALGGLFLVYFFNFTGGNFDIVVFVLTLLITALGLFFILSWQIRRKLE